jgi:hypothetical protein
MVDKVDKPDPWAPAQEALFNMVRAWAAEEHADDQEAVARECLAIMEEVNETEGAPFIFVCEMARILAIFIARYMAALNEKIPSREELMTEIDILELEYIEEFVLAEDEDDGDDKKV